MSPDITTPLPSSFRDPSGFVYQENGQYYRQVNRSYQRQYDALMDSGLYDQLVSQKLLIAHQEIALPKKTSAYKILHPEQVPFVSYPYEWCFSQLKDAALATLTIQLLALEKNMSLKDASAFNIQYIQGRPTLIDTLSFEKYPENKPWIAYHQFCQHFLAPLALMAYTDLHLGTLSTRYLDGIPLEIASNLLPGKTKFSLGLTTHIHLHNRSQKQHADTPSTTKKFSLPKQQLIGLLKNLEATVQSLRLPQQKTTWQDYYAHTNYQEGARDQKGEQIKKWITKLKPASVWDAGANNATFSRLASTQGIFTVATDIDPQAVEQAYLQQKREKDSALLPLILDLTNPTPAIGWGNNERSAFLGRQHYDLGFCLAFVHHLAIANNLPLSSIARLFSQQVDNLIIEFVPKGDSNADRLLAAREDIFPEYTEEGFERAFTDYFSIEGKILLKDSSRTLYLLKTLHS